ncbi:MAG: HAD family hydrolase [Nitriliruptorales bacterium]|nr:HAD family hydrolase [Nitriliruptorales bacterium]
MTHVPRGAERLSNSDLPPPSGPTDTGTLPAPPTTDEDLDNLDWEPDPEFDHEPDGPAPQVVVFDIGEVLIDETRVWRIWADILGVSPFTFAAVLGAAVVQGQDLDAAFGHVAPNIEWTEFSEEHERRYGGFQEEDLYPDARPCLEELKSLGVTIGIAGNQPPQRRQQLADLLLPCDHLATSADLGHDKPDPAFFTAVATLVEVSDPSEVLYVGDRVDNDVLPAHEAGMRTCWLRRGPWGLLQDLPDGVQPDLALEGLGELPLLLQLWRGEEQQ